MHAAAPSIGKSATGDAATPAVQTRVSEIRRRVSHVGSLQVAVGCVSQCAEQNSHRGRGARDNLLTYPGLGRWCGLNQHEVQIGDRQLVTLTATPCPELGDGLDTVPPPTITKVRARRRASASVSRDLDAVQNPVTNRDGLFDGLHADGHCPPTRNQRTWSRHWRAQHDLCTSASKGSPLSVGSTTAVRFAWSMEHNAGNQLGVAGADVQRHGCVTAFHGTCRNLGRKG